MVDWFIIVIFIIIIGSLLKTGLPLMKNVIKPLAKSILIRLGLTAAASAADLGIHQELVGTVTSGSRATLTISNKESEYIKKMYRYL